MVQQDIKILIVEDEFLIALSLQKQLSKLGYCVIEPVASGELAIQVAGEEEPDIILMDINLAGQIDGLQAAFIITTSYNIPIVFMSGYSDEGTLEQIRQAAPLAFLSKPVFARDVERVVQQLYA